MTTLAEKLRQVLLDDRATIAVVEQALAPDYERHEKGIRFAIRVATDREKLVYWIGRLLEDPGLAPEVVEVLGKMGYPLAAVRRIIELGEPKSSLL